MNRRTCGRFKAQALVLAALVLMTASAAESQAPAPIPAKTGVAIGTLKAGSTTVTLAYAYAAGPIDSGGKLYIVELTDQPIPDAAIAGELKRGGGQGLLRSGKLRGLSMYVDETGFVQTIVPFAGELRGEKMMASAGRLATFAIKAGQVTGQGAMTPDQTMQQGWSYAASFNATLRPIK
jgi:hypothetical protein